LPERKQGREFESRSNGNAHLDVYEGVDSMDQFR
jgi:hypothetical protein